MFFAGRLPRLPWETRARVEKMVKQYDRMNLSNTAQKFRFSTVQAKFMSFCELWERSLKAREEGGSAGRPRGRSAPAPEMPEAVSAPAAKAPPEVAAIDEAPPSRRIPPARPDPDASRIGDVGRDSARLSDLYQQVARARQEAGEPPLPFDRFATVVKAQVAKLGGGGSEVAFRVNVNNGKVTLTAKKVEE
jgi:hypothetical protein